MVAVDASCTPKVGPEAKPASTRMHVGCQRGEVNEESCAFRARLGVFNIDGGSPQIISGVGWDLDDSLRKRELCEKYGISLDAYHLPLTSAGIERQIFPNIMLGKSPERDREIEQIQQMITVAGKTGVRALLYNTTILPVLRTGYTPGRGDALYSTWDYEQAVSRNEGLTIAGEVSLDEMYERIVYLLDRILPVAEEYRVQLGNHIADPPVSLGYRGICRWNSPNIFEGVKRFAQLYDSPYHGFNLCLGSCAEGMKEPDSEIHELIRYVGGRDQIFNIHFRNIRGGFGYFQEVFPDEGDMDFYEVARTLRDVGYKYMLMHDHVPTSPGDHGNHQAVAFAHGYIKGLIQAVYSC